MRRLLVLLLLLECGGHAAALYAEAAPPRRGGPAAALQKKRRRTPRRTATVTAPGTAGTGVGNTVNERRLSLMNGAVVRSSEPSLQVVDVESGEVVAER